MKICYRCDHENFVRDDFCERCNNSISDVRPESFDIAGFIRRNYQLYGTFGILIAIFEYMLKELPDDRKYISIFPLIIALYLILHLIAKGSQIIRSRNWQHDDELLRRQSGFNFFVFCIIHSLLFFALILSLISLSESAKNFVGFVLGVFIFLVFFSSNFSNEQNRKSFGILIFSVFCIEVFLTLILLLPFVAVAVDNQNMTKDVVEKIAFYYTWFTQLFIYLGIGGIIAYFITIFGFSEDTIPFFSVFKQGNEPDYLKLFLGIVVLYGIILGTFLLSLKSLYAGFY
ncbi:MAG: hypothetical protein WC593_05985 [Methanoregula sp.]